MADRRPVLLTVSGAIPPGLDDEVAAGRVPRTDYRVMAERMDADVVDVDQAVRQCGVIGRLLHRLGGAGAVVGWYAFRHRGAYDVVFTDGEQAGLPYTLLTRVLGRRGARHVMIAHIVSVPKKARLFRWARLASQVDRYIVYCSRQAAFIRDELAVPAQRVVQSAFMVDTAFFSPDATTVPRRPMICSAGLERRDYPTFIEAVDGLDVEVIITASSLWSKRSDSTAGHELPSNVTVQRLSMSDFRDMYAAAAFVVMPLVEVDFQAGVTTILEAMSMGRAVIASRVAGQTDTITDGVTGRYVPPGDPLALRAAIEDLLDDPDTAARLGDAGRRWVLEHADVEIYADALAAVVAEVVAEVSTSAR